MNQALAEFAGCTSAESARRSLLSPQWLPKLMLVTELLHL